MGEISKDIFGKAGGSVTSPGRLGKNWPSHLCSATFFSSLQIFLSGAEAFEKLSC